MLHGEARQIEQEEIPEYFTPINGKWRMKGMFSQHIFYHEISSSNATFRRLVQNVRRL